MSTTGTLSNFRQLSLICDSPNPNAKRPNLKKQFSEDISDFKDPWFDQGRETCLNSRIKRFDKHPPVKIAWTEKADNFGLNEEVIIKKCKEIKREPSGKLARHLSLEKDSILNSKHDLRNNTQNVDKENDKTELKPNLQIFLAHNAQEFNDGQALDNFDSLTDKREERLEISKPKYLQPLVSNIGNAKAFQIRKSNSKKPLESPKAVEANQKKPNFSRSNTIVVVPLVEKLDKSSAPREPTIKKDEAKSEKYEESNGINVIIRPMTAQTRREKFQKRTNSAFHGTSKETPANFRPPLVRSSSAPSIKPEKGRFLATKRKLKNGKKANTSPKGDHSPHTLDGQEWKNVAQTASEIITMVSLISPSGSENEDESDDELKTRPKSALQREDSVVEKTTTVVKKEAISAKNVSLRKTMKSVSFQQSSIHAVRSFSASFPARRSSMATALSLGNNGNASKLKANSAKAQEKRSTNPNSPDADERVPKRRLLRSNTSEKKNSSSWQKAASQINHIIKTKNVEEVKSTFTIDIEAKTIETADELEASMKLDLEPNIILIQPLETKPSLSDEGATQKPETTCETPKEKQCWEMYCKMSEKGINVSYDTILRGMLTPTEYRIRRSASIAEEMEMLMNPPSEENQASE